MQVRPIVFIIFKISQLLRGKKLVDKIKKHRRDPLCDNVLSLAVDFFI